MCRNIKTLFNFDPPATAEEIHEASLQFVRKLTGYNKASQINEESFEEAVGEVEKITKHLLKSLKTNAEPKNREEEAGRAHERAVKRFGISK